MSGSPTPNAAARHNPRQGPLIIAVMFAFFALLLFLCMCHYHRVSRRNGENPRRNNTSTRDSAAVGTTPSSCHPNGMLKPELLAALPVFVYPLMPPRERLECAVCLTEFREGEKGRVLPRCRHSFHTECIDMWLGSHSTCPLCRVKVNSEPPDSAV